MISATGYLLFFLMGTTFGLVGAGGSILTLPILIYFFDMPVVLATTISMFIVGASALFGVVQYRKLILYQKALLFAGPSTLGIFISRFYLVPKLPQTINGHSLESILMGFLVIVMLLAGHFMIKKPIHSKTHLEGTIDYERIVAIALVLGIFMGMLGAGGGFLIVPTLVLLLRVDVKHAVATSLFIVFLNSLIGFLSDQHPHKFDSYEHIIIFTLLAWSGMYLGSHLSRYVTSTKVRMMFGCFILFMAVVIGFKEFYFQ